MSSLVVPESSWRHPSKTIARGYDIHAIYEEARRSEARALFHGFLSYLEAQSIQKERPLVFPQAVGPWPGPMWQVLLPHSERVHEDLGRCLSWLMLNRGQISIMVHPNTSPDGGGGGGALEDHEQNMIWLGPALALSLDVFRGSTEP